MKTLDVIAPIGITSIVPLDPPSRARTIIAANSFAGHIKIFPSTERDAVQVRPDAGAQATDIVISVDGAPAYTLHVFPVNYSDEASTLESHAAPLDPLSRDYTSITQSTTTSSATHFNATDRMLRRIQISGRTLVIEPGGQQGIYERLMPGGAAAKDVERVDLYADEIVIAAPLHFPGASVAIQARTLTFRDHGDAISSIRTTPDAPPEVTEECKAGADGQAAGDVSLRIGRLVEVPTESPRFLLTGGGGQKGGPEKGGTDGTNLPTLPLEPQLGGILRSWNDIHKELHDELPAHFGDGRYYGEHNYVVWFKRNNTFEWGNGEFPGDGHEGRAGGKPGTGGAGGTLHSSIELRAGIADLAGGASGEARLPAHGGRAGTPIHAVGIWIQPHTVTRRIGGGHHGEGNGGDYIEIDDPIYHFHARRSTGYPNVPSPDPSAPTGISGISVRDLTGWFHPLAASAILGYAEDCYRVGFLEQAASELRSLATNCTDSTALTDPPERYLAVRERTNALLTRLASNLDFYGNRAGWVPAIELATTLRILKSEVDQSKTLLVATELIRQQAETGQARAETVRRSRDTAVTQVLHLQESINSLAELIPELQRESANVAQDEVALERAVQDRERQLLSDARELANPHVSFIKQALRTIGTIAKVIPFGQPVLGAVGAGLDVVSRIDEQTPWETISQLPSVIDGFSKASITESLASYKKVVAKVDALDPTHPKELFAELSAASDAIGKSLAQFQKAQEASRAPASRVEEILQQLKTGDASLQDLVDRASAHTAKKGLLSRKLDEAVHELGETTSRVSMLTNQIDTFNRELVNAQDWVDHPGIVAAQEIARALRQRLDYYHYLVVCAQQYFLARPYEGNRRPAGTAESLAALLRLNGNEPEATATAFQTAYFSDVNAAGYDVVRRLAELGGGGIKTIPLVLLPNELAELNRLLAGGAGALQLELEGRGIVPLDDLEARLLDVDVTRFKTSGNVAGGATVHIDIASQETGVLRTTQRSIAFRHDSDAITWGAVVDLTRSPSVIRAVNRPTDVASVLAAVFGMAPSNDFATAMPLYPGIRVRARIQSQHSAHITVQDLAFQLKYTFRTNSDVRAVRIVTAGVDQQRPAYFVSAPDLTGAQHGSRQFTRLYSAGSAVTIIASSNVAGRRFQGWFAHDRSVETKTRLTVPTSPGSFLFEARYH